MEAGGSLRRQSSLVADSLRGAPCHLVDPATGPNRGGQNWGNSVIESGEIPLILVTVVGGSVVGTTGFDLEGHCWRSRQRRPRPVAQRPPVRRPARVTIHRPQLLREPDP